MRLTRLPSYARRARPLIKKERAWKVGITRRRPSLWAKGFLSVSGEIYDFDRYSPEHYVSDWARFTRTPSINHPLFLAIVRNKLFFHTAFESAGLGSYKPRLHGVTFAGTYYPADANGVITPVSAVMDLLGEVGGLVVKPVVGGGGKGVTILRIIDGVITCNGREMSQRKLTARLKDNKPAVVETLLTPHDYARELFPQTVNTVRMLAMRDPDSGQPFVGVAVHRMGTRASDRTDNWTQGGLSCSIDLDKGTMGPGVAHPGLGNLQWHERHPDTGAQLNGRKIPYWDESLSLVIKLMNKFSYLRYIGWDVVITPDGPRVIEGNHYSDVNLLQVHRPLLLDDRVKRFYQAHGIVK